MEKSNKQRLRDVVFESCRDKFGQFSGRELAVLGCVVLMFEMVNAQLFGVEVPIAMYGITASVVGGGIVGYSIEKK